MASTSLAITGISGNGTLVTVTYALQTYIPFVVNSNIVISGVTSTIANPSPSLYNGVYKVYTATTSAVTFYSNNTATWVSGGTITAESSLTNLPILSASGNGSTITITFPTQASTPFLAGTNVFITDVLPIGYNGQKLVATASTNSITFSGTFSGSYISGGRIISGEYNITAGLGSFDGWITTAGSTKIIGINNSSTFSYGEENWLIPGTYSWTPPSGVTSASIVCIGGGAGSTATTGGAGGGLAYINSFNLISNKSYTISVGAGGSPNFPGGDTFVLNNSYTLQTGESIIFERIQYVGQVEISGASSPSTTTWTVPKFVSNMSAVAIGGGGGAGGTSYGSGGGGGGLSYIGSTSVLTGTTYTLSAGAAGTAGINGGSSSVSGTGVNITGGGGTKGGAVGFINAYAGPGRSGGGGAAGYTGSGGTGAGSTGYPGSVVAGGAGGTGTYLGGTGGRTGYVNVTGNLYNGAAVYTSDNIAATSGSGDGGYGGAWSRGSSTTSAGSVSFQITATFSGTTMTVVNYGGGTLAAGQLIDIIYLNSGGRYYQGIGYTIIGLISGNQWSVSVSLPTSASNYSVKVYPAGYGLYGGGGAGDYDNASTGAPGGVRLIYGPNRYYPSTNTLNQTAYLTNMIMPSTLTANLSVGMPISFDFSIGNITAGNVYYISYKDASNNVQIVANSTTSNYNGYGDDFGVNAVGTIFYSTPNCNINFSSVKGNGGGTSYNSVATSYNAISSASYNGGTAGGQYGGGAAGYLGVGANGNTAATTGSGAGAGGQLYQGGGGVGIYGYVSGNDGQIGSSNKGVFGYSGNTGISSQGGTGGQFGGGGGFPNASGGFGAVRIIWSNGTPRTFPSTLTGANNNYIASSGSLSLTLQKIYSPAIPQGSSVSSVTTISNSSGAVEVNMGSSALSVGKASFQLGGNAITFLSNSYNNLGLNYFYNSMKTIKAINLDYTNSVINLGNFSITNNNTIIYTREDLDNSFNPGLYSSIKTTISNISKFDQFTPSTLNISINSPVTNARLSLLNTSANLNNELFTTTPIANITNTRLDNSYNISQEPNLFSFLSNIITSKIRLDNTFDLSQERNLFSNTFEDNVVVGRIDTNTTFNFALYLSKIMKAGRLDINGIDLHLEPNQFTAINPDLINITRIEIFRSDQNLSLLIDDRVGWS